ncbi:hypothetical protein [Ruegeria atlantica]|uniref:hypothetical protein n=1 Tax=Ruegeria atlantica TaxID=81569 RepID=UPI00147ECEE6|nr:hypothetical protein [Ruegeria atlantica]
MYEEYDKSLHPPLKYKSMESEARVLDETTLDTAIADLLQEDDSEALKPVEVQATFPELPDQSQIDMQASSQEAGLTAVLLQKWAELRGAA